MSFYFGGEEGDFHVNSEKKKKNRLSEITFLLPSKPSAILPSPCNHVSGLKANPKKLKIVLNEPQLPVAARKDTDHRQKAVLPTWRSRGMFSSQN